MTFITPCLMTKTKYNFGGRGSNKISPSFNKPELLRCKACELKYPVEELVIYAGHWICKYCMKDLEKHLKGVG